MARTDNWSRLEVSPNSALILIDVQNGFIGPNTESLPERIATMINAIGDKFQLRIATRFVNEADSNYRRLINWTRLGGPPETDLIPEVADAADEVIEKSTYAAIDKLEVLLHRASIDSVYLAGIDTDVCVLQNAAGLFDAGFTPFVLIDATGTNGGPEAQAAAIPLLGRTIGRGQLIQLDDL